MRIMNRKSLFGLCVVVVLVLFDLSTASVYAAKVRTKIPNRYPSDGVDCSRDVTLPECEQYVAWMNYLSPAIVVGDPDSVESRALPSEVTDILQNPSLTSPQNSTLPTELTDEQKVADLKAAQEYATTTSPTERATILETTGLTNDQLMSIAIENGSTSSSTSVGNTTGSAAVGSTNERIVSPAPIGGNSTLPVGGGGGSTSANRPLATGASTPGGLYIPTKADTGLSDMKVSDLIQNLMKWLLYIVGFVAIIAFVISGIQYLLAGASEEMAKKAKENMQYAIIGVVVALSALIIIRAVQSVLSGAWIF